MMRNRDTAAEAFLQGRATTKAGTVFSTGTSIYSYGEHFPMASRTGEGRIWVNEDKYSVTTSGHQNALRAALTRAGYAPTGDPIPMLGGPAPFVGRIWVRS
jgi:hypothetical protein